MRILVRTISAGIVSAFAASGAFAADLPSRKAPPPVPVALAQPYTWTGCHAGIHAGYAYDDYHFAVFTSSPAAGAAFSRSKVFTQGPLGGGEIGCDYQLPWNIVVGVAADLDGAGVHGSSSFVAPLNGFAGPTGLIGGVNTQTRVNAFGSVRVRVGYAFDRLLFTDNVLIYLTAGAGYGSIRDNVTAFAGPSFATWSRSRNPFGAGKEPGVVGIGIEKMITPNWSVSAEYHYHYMGASTPSLTLAPAGLAQFGTRAMYHLARVGVNYRFGWSDPVPVVARY